MRVVGSEQPTTERVEQAKKYLIAMFGHIERGWVTFHGQRPDGGGWQADIHVADLKAPNSLIEAADRCIELADEGYDVYVATSVMGVPRGRSEKDATFTPALIAEFDRASSSTNKDNPWETLQEVENFLAGVGVPASMIVESGNGWHAYWLLEEPLVWDGFDKTGDREFPKRTLTRFLGWLRSVAEHDMDSVADGARVFRVPGTFNYKAKPKPVTIEKLEPAIRYSSEAVAMELIPTSVTATHSFNGSTTDVTQADRDEWLDKSVEQTTTAGRFIIKEAMRLLTAGSDRHPSMRDAVAYLVQDSRRAEINMGEAIERLSDEFDKIKPPDEQFPRPRYDAAGNVIDSEFISTKDWVIDRRIAEARSIAAERTATSETLKEAIGENPSLPNIEPGVDTHVTDMKPEVHDAALNEMAAKYQMQAAAREIATANINEARFERDWVMPPVVSMQDFILADYPPVEYRVDGLWTAGSKIIVSAEAKAGKTTLMLNLFDALLDGGQFLDKFDVNGPNGRLMFVNFEVSERQMHEWMSRGRARHPENADVLNGLGYGNLFDVRVPRNRAALGEIFERQGTTLLIVDVLGAILDGLGIDENSNSEVGEVLAGFDSLLDETQIEDLAIVHHFGHSGDRARGASKLLGWPDGLWTYHVAENHDEEITPQAARFLSVKGRDVSLPKSEVKFDPLTNRVYMTDGDSPAKVQATGLREHREREIIKRVRKGAALGEDVSSGDIKNDVDGRDQVLIDICNDMADAGRLIKREGMGATKQATYWTIGPNEHGIEDQVTPTGVVTMPTMPTMPNHAANSGMVTDDPRRNNCASPNGHGTVITSSGEGSSVAEVENGMVTSEVRKKLEDALVTDSARAVAEMPMGDVVATAVDTDADTGADAESHECPTCTGPLIEVMDEMICAGGCE